MDNCTKKRKKKQKEKEKKEERKKSPNKKPSKERPEKPLNMQGVGDAECIWLGKRCFQKVKRADFRYGGNNQ